ncbi:MAG TPA: hypothetical protein VI386_23910 [Candidatus Sulfotelmatobacter sp.]
MAEVSGTSFPPPARSPLMRLLIPSVGDLIFMTMLGTLLWTPLSVRLLNDAGTGWHIRTGQIIADTHQIPRVDPFSSIMKGHPWFAWECLYEVAVGQLQRVAGLNGVVWLTAVVIALVYSWTFRLLIQRGVDVFLALMLVLLASGAGMIHFLARPHVFSWLFTLAWFWILDSNELAGIGIDGEEKRRTAKLLWLLPPLMIVWVNVHGGFVLGLVLLGIYMVSAAHSWIKSRETSLEEAMTGLRARHRFRQLAQITLGAAIATLCNPQGWTLHSHIYHYLTNRFLMDHIDEFGSPNFHGVAEWCFAVLVLLTLLAVATRTSSLRVSEGLVVIFAVYSGLYSVRNLPVSSLLLVLTAGPLLAKSLEKLPQTANLGVFDFWRRMRKIEASLGGFLWSVAALAIAFGIALNGGRLGSWQLLNAHFSERRFPATALDHLEANNNWGPILAPDYWGGYLIYRLYPQVLVVMDDRSDLYGENIFRDYLAMTQARPGWQKFLIDHHVCCVLAPRGSALANILAQSQDWKEIYGDDVARAFNKVY